MPLRQQDFGDVLIRLDVEEAELRTIARKFPELLDTEQVQVCVEHDCGRGVA